MPSERKRCARTQRVSGPTARARRLHRHAFTLIEILLASAIVVILAVLFYESFAITSTTTARVELRLEALVQARTLLEDLRSLPLNAGPLSRLGEDRFSPIRDGPLASANDTHRSMRSYRVERVSENARRLRVSVQWKENLDSDRRSVELDTIIARSTLDCLTPSRNATATPPAPPCRLCRWKQVIRRSDGVLQWGDSCEKELPGSVACPDEPPPGAGCALRTPPDGGSILWELVSSKACR